MSEGHQLSGSMIPRTVRRMFDQRDEERVIAKSMTAVMGLRGRRHLVRLVNVSHSGAMVLFTQVPHIGEELTLQLAGQQEVSGHVRWAREGRMGIHFATPLE